MPYYVYRITSNPIRMLKKLDQQDTYRDASASVKRRRAELPEAPGVQIRMIHAENEFDAEDLLNQIREASVESGDE